MDRMNRVTDEYFVFLDRYGWIGCIEGLAPFAYECNRTKNTYKIPDSVTTEMIENLVEKSVTDNHDYICDLIARKENEIGKYKEGLLY